MLLIVKGSKADAEQQLKQRGFVARFVGMHQAFEETQWSVEPTPLYRKKAVEWFIEEPLLPNPPFPKGTLLYHD